jgi:hypothetical protein
MKICHIGLTFLGGLQSQSRKGIMLIQEPSMGILSIYPNADRHPTEEELKEMKECFYSTLEKSLKDLFKNYKAKPLQTVTLNYTSFLESAPGSPVDLEDWEYDYLVNIITPKEAARIWEKAGGPLSKAMQKRFESDKES